MSEQTGVSEQTVFREILQRGLSPKLGESRFPNLKKLFVVVGGGGVIGK